ncbi:MAG: S49 family peptidase [Amphritea sp.]|nr:S49 family peptidase [Amphritea sp.]
MRHSLVQQLIMDEPLMISAAKLETILAVVAEREGLNVTAEQMMGRGDSSTLTAGGSVAVIPVTGSITHRPTGLSAMSGLTSYEQIDAQLDQALSDSSVTEIVLDINSPGGMVAGVFDLADRIYEAREHKPITAIVNEGAYSAAYAIASAATEIIVPRTGGVGSIGVITAHVDKSAQNEQKGLSVTYITAGAKKAYGNPDQPLSSEALSDIQQRVDKSYELFVSTVARNRGLAVDGIRNTEAGTFSGADAVSAGLADRVMSARDALSMILQRNAKKEPTSRTVGRRARAIAIQS